VFIGNREFLDCTECPRCKAKEGLKHGVRYGICSMSGNLVYLDPWKEQKACGSGWIHHHVSSCALYEKKEENSQS
jgi:hypothetical protein